MKMKATILGKVFVLLCVLSATAVAMQDQTFRLDPGINLVSTDISAVQDPNTRNILVIFNEVNVNNASYARVHIVFLKHKGDGTYKRKKLWTISPAGSWAGRPHGAYLTGMKRFLVVWDTADPATFGIPSKIVGQLIKANNGKPKGGNFDVVNDGGLNVAPVLARVPEPISPSPKSSPADDIEDTIKAILFWNRYDTNDYFGDNLGLVYRPVTRVNRNTLGISNMYEWALRPIRFDGGVQLGSIPDNAYTISAELGGGKADYLIGLTYEDQYRDGSQDSTKGVSSLISGVYNPDVGLSLSIEAFYEFGDNSTAQRGPGIATLSNIPMECEMGSISFDREMHQYNFFRFRGGVGDTEMTLQEKIDLVLGGGEIRVAKSLTNYNFQEAPNIITFVNNFVPAANETRGHIVAANSDGWVYQQRIKDQTKFKKGPVKIFQHNDKMQSMNVYRIDFLGDPGGWNNALILWQRKINNTRHEARAYITKLK